MIEICHAMGREELARLKGAERTKAFLDSQTILPERSSQLDEDQHRELVLNVDRDNGMLEIKLGNELAPEYRDEFFGFELMGSAGRKVYATTNNWFYHLYTIPQLLSYVQDCLPDKEDFIEYLRGLRDDYCLEYDEDHILDLGKLDPDLRNEPIAREFEEEHELELSNPDALIRALQKSNFEKKKYRGLFNELASKAVLGSTRKNDVDNINICSLKVDGEYLHKGQYWKDYVDVVEHKRQGRFFGTSEKLVKEDRTCSLCVSDKTVTGKIDIPTKFYITDKPYFFEQGDQKKAYRSFACCEPCYQEIQVGIDRIKRDYSGWLFGCRFYIVPKRISGVQNLDAKSRYIRERILNRGAGTDGDEVERHSRLVREMLEEDLRFDFVFFFEDQAAFNIVETVPEVSFGRLHELESSFAKVNDERPFVGHTPPVSLNSLYWLMFPNRYSHPNPDPEIYRKDLVGMFKALIKGYPVSYRTVLRRFCDIFKRRFHRQDDISPFIGSPLQMSRLISVFNQMSSLKGVKHMEKSSVSLDVPDEDLRDFFRSHETVYAESPTRRGLVMLGYLMNGIWWEQHKEDKSRTILEKINFDGMSPRRLDRFVNDITEYLKVYDIWKYPDTGSMHAAMLDHLQEAEQSDLSKDEVVFYILTGFSFARYAGIENQS